MERKSFDLKDIGDSGKITAVFATFNVIDKDGDVTLPGAFGQQEVKVQPAHDSSTFALGKGRTRETSTEALVDIQMNLDIPAARDWFKSIQFDLNPKYGPPLQEWSYGYRILDSDYEVRDDVEVQILKSVAVHEVSPVMLGAGENTRTVSTKSKHEDHRHDPYVIYAQGVYDRLRRTLS